MPVTPRELGRWMAGRHAFHDLADGRDPAELGRSIVTDVATIPASDPLALAVVETGLAARAWGGYAYHSSAHHGEVGMNVMLLVSLAHLNGSRIGDRFTLLLAAAALGHDLDYDPSMPEGESFFRERASALAVDRICSRCGVNAKDREIIRLLILSTYPLARSYLRQALQGEVNVLPRQIRSLEGQPSVMELAAMLSDADLLSSAGLTPERCAILEGRLLEERGHSQPSDRDRLFFFDRIVGPGFLSVPGSFFDVNLSEIRQAMIRDAPPERTRASI